MNIPTGATHYNSATKTFIKWNDQREVGAFFICGEWCDAPVHANVLKGSKHIKPVKGLYCGQYKITHLVTVERNGGELSDITMAIGSLDNVANTFVLTQTDCKGNYSWSTYFIESFQACVTLIGDKGDIKHIELNNGVVEE